MALPLSDTRSEFLICFNMVRQYQFVLEPETHAHMALFYIGTPTCRWVSGMRNSPGERWGSCIPAYTHVHQDVLFNYFGLEEHDTNELRTMILGMKPDRIKALRTELGLPYKEINCMRTQMPTIEVAVPVTSQLKSNVITIDDWKNVYVR